jgi:hypothetical protein
VEAPTSEAVDERRERLGVRDREEEAVHNPPDVGGRAERRVGVSRPREAAEVVGDREHTVRREARGGGQQLLDASQV